MPTFKRNGDFLFLRNGKLTCRCCCEIEECVEIPTFEYVFNAFRKGFGGGGSDFFGSDAYNSPAAGRFFRAPACLKFYYRVVNQYKGENGTVVCEGNIGSSGAEDGKTAVETASDFREDKSNLIVGEVCGLYIYVIDFYYWRSICTDSEFWSERGGAQYNEETGECGYIDLYNVKMYRVSQHYWDLESNSPI